MYSAFGGNFIAVFLSGGCNNAIVFAIVLNNSSIPFDIFAEVIVKIAPISFAKFFASFSGTSPNRSVLFPTKARTNFLYKLLMTLNCWNVLFYIINPKVSKFIKRIFVCYIINKNTNRNIFIKKFSYVL